MTEHLRLAIKAAVLGALVGLTFLVFEWLVNHGIQYVWNDVFQTDTNRWGVIPLAIVLSIALSGLVRGFGQRRTVPPKVDLLAGDGEVRKTTLRSIGVIFSIGIASLLAGASLGPEMSLMMMSSALGTWIAARGADADHPKLLALAAVGALLVAFFGSLFPAIIPLLLIYKERRNVRLGEIIPVGLAGAAAYLTLIAVKGHAAGYGSIPVGSHFHPSDFLTAVLLGLAGVLAAFGLKWVIHKLSSVAQWIDRRWSWPVTAAVFGTGIGLLYFAGGESVQFSGSEGVHQLVQQAPSYGAAALAILVITKLLVTAWSEATGYRGGLVFPSIYIGTALSLLAGSLVGGLAGPGAMIGAIGGIMAAMTSPILAAIMLISLLPLKMVGLALAGIVGAVIGNKLFARWAPKPGSGHT